MAKSWPRPPRFRSNSRAYDLLEEISAGDLFVGFLTSARSTRLMYKNAAARARERYARKLATQRLERCGYISRKEKSGETVFFATPLGKRALSLLYKQTAKMRQRPESWDKYWRIVSYDLPEEERSRRNSLRHVLGKCGFLQIQKSVWIFPYDAVPLAELLANDKIISRHVLSMKVTSISSDQSYKKHFGLR